MASALQRLVSAVNKNDVPTANRRFMEVMQEKMKAVIADKYEQAAKDFGRMVNPSA
jgi:hypothetical protein